jgi:genome maintenance exonuclease 1
LKEFNLPHIETENVDGRRYYLTPQGKFPSVTTVLALQAKEGLEKWKQRMGEEKAEFLRNRAAERGNIIHGMMEDYVAGNPVNPPTPFHRSLYLELKKYLDATMKEPWCIETPLYSTQLKVAGRTDLIAEFEEPEIVDFKGSTSQKKEEYVKGYRMQVCCYAAMFKERTGIQINKYRILVVDEFAQLQIFTGNTKDHLLDFARLRMQFAKQFEQ